MTTFVGAGRPSALSLPAVPRASLLPDRVLLAAAVVLTCVLIVPHASDPVNVVKLSALLVCAVALAALAVARVVRDRVLRVPVGAPAVLGLVLLAAFCLATVVAPQTATAVYGTLGRNSGLLAYAAALLLYLVGLRVLDPGTTRAVLMGVLLAGLFTGLYGLLQYLGVDAVPWNNPFNPIIAGLGNPDFASAYLGIAAPAAAWGALWTGWPLVLRALSGATLVLLLVVAALSSAVQGPLAAASGLAVLLVAWLSDHTGRLRRAGTAAVAGLAVLGIAGLVLGLRGAGPAAAFFSGISYRARTWYWEAALTMFRHSPVWGVGLDSYGARWRLDRPVEVPRELGGDHFSDAAHSVPLQMLAQGGLVLGLAYLALVVLVAVRLVRGLQRLRGPQRLQLGALGGCWVAYQVQSAVSIDQVPLLVVHLVLAAAVLVASGGVRLREVRLPGALKEVRPASGGTRRRGPSVAVPRQRALTAGDRAALGLAGVVALGLAWAAVTPTRASHAAYTGAALSDSDPTAALAAYDHAISLEPTVSAYRTSKGSLLNSLGQPQAALAAYASAAKVDPYDIAAVRTSGRLAQSLGDLQAARRWFEKAVRLDPTNRDTVFDLSRFLTARGDTAGARRLLERTNTLLPDDSQVLGVLGGARLAAGDRAGARAAWERALQLEPGQPAATAGLAQLAAPTGAGR